VPVVTLTGVHERTSMTVIFGVDRHKSTHAAVAIGRDERPPVCQGDVRHRR
jgi:hypothetical protein